MTTEDFIKTLKEWLAEIGWDDEYTIGTDLSYNTDITIDDDGFIYLTQYEGFKRVLTPINTHNIVEFRHEVDKEYGFFVICKGDIALSFQTDGIYFCEDGTFSGFGTGFDHFSKFPVEVDRKTYEWNYKDEVNTPEKRRQDVSNSILDSLRGSD